MIHYREGIFTLLHNSVLLLLCSDNQKMVLLPVFKGTELKILSFLLGKLIQKHFKRMKNSMLLQVVRNVVQVEEQSYIWPPWMSSDPWLL